MLVACPECGLQVSDKAISCPHCGYPLKEQPRQRVSTKRKRLPNGFGQISFLKGRNLRKPFRAMVTVAKTDLGRPICKTISYHTTYNEAYEALMAYHKDPNKIDSNITMSELYIMWQKDFKGAHAYFKSLKTGWKYCSEIYNSKVSDVKIRHIKSCLERGVAVRDGKEIVPTYNTQRTIKSLLSSMLDYAMEYDLVDHNYAKDVNVAKIVERGTPIQKKPHTTFTQKDFEFLRSHLDDPIARMILVQCYTGMRPQEICLIKRATLDLVDWYFVGGIKTKSGKDRTIPIHDEIKNIVRDFYAESEGSEYLFPINSYKVYLKRFSGIMSNHMPHDPRKTFVTYAKKYNVDEYAIKRIIGHSIQDVTESIYTERTIDWLHSELRKIKM